MDKWLTIFTKLLHRLLPSQCYLCGAVSRQFLCVDCCEDLPTADSASSCGTCGLPLSEGLRANEPPESHPQRCGDCVKHPKPFQLTLAAFVYGHPVDFLINRFKHNRHLVCGNYLSKHLLPALEHAYGESTWPDLLVPMPLHWTRRTIRGFNQSDAIAVQLHKALGIPLSHACRRLKRNPRQQQLKRKERLRNLQNAFEVQTPLDGAHVAVIDDVMTTGATVTELTRSLRKAGAARVDVWVLARVP